MNRIFSKLHVGSLIQSNAIYSRDLASATLITQTKAKLPKPTPNAFALFLKTKFRKGTSMVGLAKEWKSSSDKEKKKFTEEAAKLRKEAIAQFEKLPKKEQQEQLVEAAKSRADLKNSRAYYQFLKDTNCPTPALNAIAIFSQEKYRANRLRHFFAYNAVEEFQNLSEEEKKPYVEKFNQQAEAYKSAYEKWYKDHGEDYEKLKK
uniref:HMG box domain-containing protein n=1 Tax=Panagrolaimus superbus TaxID=310955 RepID=A0A914Z9J1_9BILA